MKIIIGVSLRQGKIHRNFDYFSKPDKPFFQQQFGADFGKKYVNLRLQRGEKKDPKFG
jgi:hypothetical protein